MTEEFLDSAKTIKSRYDFAFTIFEEAVNEENKGNNISALEKYNETIEIIDQVLQIPVRIPEEVDSVEQILADTRKIIHKLKRARANISQRLNELSDKTENGYENNSGASYIPNENHRNSNTNLDTVLKGLEYIETETNDLDLELLFSCEGVKLYHIRSDGTVTMTTDNCIMRILRLNRNESRNIKAKFFIQLIKSENAVDIQDIESGLTHQENDFSSILEEKENFKEVLKTLETINDSSWIYPLIPGVSPCYRTNYGAFILPDTETITTGISFGFIVPKENGADDIVFEILEEILQCSIVVESCPDSVTTNEPKTFSTRVSGNIVKSAYYISQNLIKGAGKVGELITYSTPHLISQIKKAPSDNNNVSNNVIKNVQTAKDLTGTAAKFTGFVVNKVGSSTLALGKFLAPHIQKHGSILLSKSLGITEAKAEEKMNDVLTIAAGALDGIGTVYDGLEQSAIILGQSLSSNSVKVIEHRYGHSAGMLATETFDTVGNVLNLRRNINHITVKGLVKNTAKNTSKAIVKKSPSDSLN